MRLLSKIAIAGVALAFLVAMAQPVMAGCTNNYLVTTSSAEGSTFIYTPGHFVPGGALGGYASEAGLGALSPNAEAFWWQLGQGNPIVGTGLDNGSWGVENWIPAYSIGYDYLLYYYASVINGGWGQDPAAIDGCISDDGVVLGECMCVLVTDEFDGQGYGAIFGALTNSNGFALMNIPGGQQLLGLPALPDTTILGSMRDADNNLTLQVGTSAGANDFSKDGCNCAGTMGFKVYTNTVMRNAAPPVSRDAGWVEASGPTPITDAAMINLSCGASNVDIYVSTSMVSDSGFETEISANSTRVECGPTIANPDDLQELRPGRQTPREPRQGRTR